MSTSHATTSSERPADRLEALIEGFHARNARPFGVVAIAGHRLKAYALEAPGRAVADKILEGLDAVIGQVLTSHGQIGTCGLGFVILHAGGDGEYLLVQTWSAAHMSQLTILTGPPDSPDALRPAPTSLSACVWEARIIAHERDSYASTVLTGAGDLEQRLARWEVDLLPAGLVR